MSDNPQLPHFDLTGRTALVTGASSGFGAHWARLLAAAGARVVVAARRTDRLAALVEDIRRDGGSAHAVALDVTDEAATAAAYAEAESVFGTVDTIIANAGTSTEKSSLLTSGAEFDTIVDTNLKGVFLTVTEGARRLIAAGSAESGRGRVVIVGSITARKLYSGTAPYSASKAGVGHMGRVLARELARKGINVNVILPGYFDTEMTGDMWNAPSGDYLMKNFPRRRLGVIGDMDVPLLFFASDLSRHVTGSELVIDDGQSL
ncbi:SDR family NAD(P)-dependent oxidoreductase [Novosphingobium tardum]|uniref:SDR family NAD(P)-dependent oxidoreductase n=1 Tax=Novosphingobium tardum TaxID=1538021 RepID=A0ABV8RMM1_9SPHN